MSFRQHLVSPTRPFQTRLFAPFSPDEQGIPPPAKRVRSSYTIKEKVRVAELAESDGFVRRVAKMEGHSYTNVRRWIQQKDSLKKKLELLKKKKKTRVYRLND
jgi:hypothetical protein